MIFYQGFIFYIIKRKNYNAGAFIEGATFISMVIIIIFNIQIQKTIRNFLIINIQIENLYKEQAVIFENLTDGAIIH